MRCLEFTLFSGVVWSSHCSVGWSAVHIVQWGGLQFTLLSGGIWSSHCSVGGSGVHIVQRGGLEFKLFSGVVRSSNCSVEWSGVYIVQWSGVYAVVLKTEWRMEWRQMVKSVEDSSWGPRVIHRLEIRSCPWNLKEKKKINKLHKYLMKFRKQEAHGPHRSAEKQFYTINIFVQKYDYTISLRKKTIISFLTFLTHSPFFQTSRYLNVVIFQIVLFMS